MKKKIKAFFLNFPTQKIKARELAVKLKITSVSEYESMKHFLHQLEKEGFVQRSGKRYSFCNLGTGKISGTLTLVNGGSYGFVVTDDKAQSDIFISQRNLGTALQGDKVEISLFAKQRGKNLEGEIINVIFQK